MCCDFKSTRILPQFELISKTIKGKAHACLTLLIEIINKTVLIMFYTEQRVRKQLLDDPLHLHAEVIRQKLHGPGLRSHPF